MSNIIVQNPQPTNRDIGKVGDVSVQVNIDVLQLLILALSSVTCIYAVLVKHRVDRSPLSDILAKIKPQDFYKDKRIEALMNRMLAVGGTIKAPVSRVCVALFTNGTKAHMFPFRYFSIFWEVTNFGVEPTKHKYQHIPLDRIKDDLELYMNKDGKFIQSSVDGEGISPGCENYLRNCGIHTVLGKLIGSKSNGYVGIINIHYQSSPILSEECLEGLENLFTILASEILEH